MNNLVIFFIFLKLFTVLAIAKNATYKILFIYNTGDDSHRKSMYPLARSLAQHGHDVTMLVTGVKEYHKLPSENDLGRVKPAYITFTMSKTWLDYRTNFLKNVTWDQAYFHPEQMVNIWRFQINMTESLIEQNGTEYARIILAKKWDFVVVNALFTPMGILTPLLLKNTTFGVLFTTSTLASASFYRPMPHPWSYVPALYIPNIDYSHKIFASRLASVWTDLKETISVHYTDHILHQTLSKYHPDISLHALYNKPRLAFKASSMLIDYARPRTRDMIYFGGTCSKKPHSIRDPELKSFIQNDDSDGTIVVAFGHAVRWETAPEIVKRNFVAALNHFTRYRIVWQFDGDSSGLQLGKHIKRMTWIPQEALLLHPKTKLFITHGGIKSTTETICAAVPAVIIPFFAEQIRNAHLMAKSGCGLPLLKSNLTTANIIGVLKKVLNDESFIENIKKLKSFFIDRPMDFIDEGTFWTEFVIRRKNCEKWLISRANRMPFVKRLMIDTLVVVLFIVALFLYVVSHTFMQQKSN